MSSCDCIYVGDYDEANFSKKSNPKAKKEHNCTECGEKIGVGDKYEKTVYRFGNDFGLSKLCPICIDLRDEFFCNGFTYGHLMEDFQQHLWDMQGNISSDCLGRLIPAARERIIEMIDDILEECAEDGDESEVEKEVVFI